MVCKLFNNIVKSSHLFVKSGLISNMYIQSIYKFPPSDIVRNSRKGYQDIAVSPNHKYIAILLSSGNSPRSTVSLKLLNEDGISLRTFNRFTNAHSVDPTTLRHAFTPDSRYLIEVQSIKVLAYDVNNISNTPISIIDRSDYHNKCDNILFLSDQKFIVVCNSEVRINLVYPEEWMTKYTASLYQIEGKQIKLVNQIKCKSTHVGRDQVISFLSFNKDKLAIFAKGKLQLYTTNDFKLITTVEVPHLSYPTKAYFINEDKEIIFTTYSSVHVFDLKSQALNKLEFKHIIKDMGVDIVPITDQQVLIIGSSSRWGKIEDVKSIFFNYNVKTKEMATIMFLNQELTGLHAYTNAFYNNQKFTFFGYDQIARGEFSIKDVSAITTPLEKKDIAESQKDGCLVM